MKNNELKNYKIAYAQHRIKLIASKSLIYESSNGLSICDLFINFIA